MITNVKTFFFSALCCLTLMLTGTSCSNDEDAPAAELGLSVNSLSFSGNGELKNFNIKANQRWEVSSAETWLSLSPTSGNAGTITIDVVADANPLTTNRTGTILAKVGSLSKTINVTQRAPSVLIVDQNEFEVTTDGGEIVVQVESSGTYQLSIDGAWIKEVPGGNAATPAFSILANPSMITREGTIEFTLNELTQTVTVSQTGNELNIPADNTGMNDNAITLAPKMGIGWNMGNTLEATSAIDESGISTASETAWGNPKASQALIDVVKAAGFNTIRIPCAWNGYIEDHSTYKIKDSWLLRVREVIDYCVARDVYAIINIHWDGGWLENNPTYDKQTAVNAKQKALWEQIAVALRDYDEHLLFAGTNEVHFDYNDPTDEHIEVQESYNQTFVNAVRSTGGKNTYRNLIVQGYNTNIGYTEEYMTMPTDATTDRLMAEIHYYDPYDFTLDITSNKYYWGTEFAGLDNTSTWGQEDRVHSEFEKMKTKFVNNNIPVILGEYAATLRSTLTGQTLLNHITSRNNYLHYVTKVALENGLVPVYWDNGGTGNNASGLFNRATNTPFHTDAIEAIISAKD